MDGHCPPVRWVSSITSCSNQPVLLCQPSFFSDRQTDSHQIFPIKPSRHHHHHQTDRPLTISANNHEKCQPTRSAQRAWESQIRVWFLLASACILYFILSLPVEAPQKKQGGVWSPQVCRGADITIKLPLLSIWSGWGGNEGSLNFPGSYSVGQRQAVISLGTHWHKLNKSGFLFQSWLKTSPP